MHQAGPRLPPPPAGLSAAGERRCSPGAAPPVLSVRHMHTTDTTTDLTNPDDGTVEAEVAPIIETVGLTKTYAGTDFRAVDALDLRARARGGLRPARPQRRRQDHHGGGADHQGDPDGGAGPRRRDRRHQPSRTGQAAHRRGVAAEHLGPPAQHPGESVLARSALRHGGEGVAPDGRRAARAVPAHSLRIGIGLRALRWHGAAPHGGPRHLPSTGRPVPGRAHGGAGPPGPPRASGSFSRASTPTGRRSC